MIRLKQQQSSINSFLNVLAEREAPIEEVAEVTDQPDAIIPDFSSPYLELVRLLRESSEIEHALMVQYLYAAFTIRDAYADVMGAAVTNGTGLLSIAVQEMEHLHHVTQLLVALGAAPNLVSQDFPYDPDIYPFTLDLQRLTPHSLAMYVFTEAPAEAVTPQPGVKDPFLERLYEQLGDVRPNHLGSVYARIIQLAEQVQASPPFALPDLTPFIQELHRIKEQGEEAHFHFFKSVFLAEHSGFHDIPVWSLSPDDPAYPSFPVQENPSAYEGHPHQISDVESRSLAMLGNLHYWIILMLLDLSYRFQKPSYLGLAIANHMTGALVMLGPLLARRGVGLPFDPSNLSSSTGIDEPTNVRILKALVMEAQKRTDSLRGSLGSDETDLQILSLQDTLDNL